MFKRMVVLVFVATAGVIFSHVDAANLRHHESARDLEASDSGSTELLLDELFGDRFLTLSIDGSTLDGSKDLDDEGLGDASLEASQELDGGSDDDVTDSQDSEDGSEDNLGTPYQPGTIKPASIDSSSQGFDKDSLSWWK
ncbi:sporangia induced hypothetical protein [Phytophthora infestans T30-4]|uniref:Secreted RxLR effector peptide protein n=2 Tax=Phytophthora infestans TaxID=4787 RepID=D0N0H7_PHYIT|nr:sporangia induced hypothetical protein [Phytophthora infestans T30-4]EEY67140.1 sporangia induced hypothetical protein [Phytophthora infestans T30-4]KAF4046757.1 hypothetical protein GN244_ATG00756 [Phytophthora infestans]KAF4130462.1 hypothetical protein GN958_ATG20356 [Phytophthora infestans]KAI9984968.1 hypothetical protein PInf_004272 [Phytophthora infestans]|eukprot:XP_002905788.1 sporangia induced hypothetical protein [Phytophthora infestans T30-4]